MHLVDFITIELGDILCIHANTKNMLCMTIMLKKTRKYVINNNIGIVK